MNRSSLRLIALLLAGLTVVAQTAGGYMATYRPPDAGQSPPEGVTPTLPDRLLDRLSQYKPFYYKQLGWLILGALNLLALSWLAVYLVVCALPRASQGLRKSLWIALALDWALFLAMALVGSRLS